MTSDQALSYVAFEMQAGLATRRGTLTLENVTGGPAADELGGDRGWTFHDLSHHRADEHDTHSAGIQTVAEMTEGEWVATTAHIHRPEPSRD